MAKIFAGWKVSITFLDQGQQQVSKTYDLRNGATDLVADVEAAASNLIADIEAVTTAEITGFNLLKSFVEDTVAVPTVAQNENTAQLSVNIDGNPLKRAIITIPAPDESIFVDTTGPNNNVVDATNAAVIDLVNNFRTGGTVTISDGEDADLLIGGVRVHRRSGRSRQRRIG